MRTNVSLLRPALLFALFVALIAERAAAQDPPDKPKTPRVLTRKAREKVLLREFDETVERLTKLR